jgi:pyruvate,water dikinase
MIKVIEDLKSLFGHRKGLPFNVLFEHFRDVLKNNTRALEIITDMGEKLSGDYLFDINYIKGAYSELTAVVKDSLQGFDMLTQSSYSQLHETLNRIDRQIRGALNDRIQSTGEAVIFYENILWDKYHVVGGKNANLAELKNYLKLNVPEAFSITTYAFDKFLKHNNLQEIIKAIDVNTAESKLKELQDSIINSEIPPDLDIAIGKALEEIRKRCGGDCFLAVRSSAEEEDREFSFAGQFETVLNVPLESGAVEEAYKKVIASLFSEKAAIYMKQLGYGISNFKMAAGCMVMVDAVSSGVIYSVNPHRDDDAMIINATWGLGRSIVEGEVAADFYAVRKVLTPEIIDEKTGRKESMIINHKEGGTKKVKTPDAIRDKPCLSKEQVLELARLSMHIEKHFRGPQDIEWAIDKGGRIFILQARPLRTDERNYSAETYFSKKGLLSEERLTRRILMNGKGIAIQKGVAAGRVFILKQADELDRVPKAAVLVSKHDSSNFIKVMPYISAIVTDTGTPTSHMASLCREFRIPAIVNTGDATGILKHGQEITLYLDDDEKNVIYEGIIGELLEYADLTSRRMEEIYEFRKKRYILRYISPLNLVDPMMESFTIEGCKTMHDILRFIHEKAVTELVEGARYGLKGSPPVKLDLPIPTGIVVIDIGGGLNIIQGKRSAAYGEITSIPLKAIIKGMLHPGVWHSDAIPLKAGDFFTSMMRMDDIVSGSANFSSQHIAIASREYLNMGLRFGYHFNLIDSYCSENPRNNHIYFRFAGGATDITKRSRRIQLIADILKEYGFSIKIKGDLIIARLANIGRDEMENILDRLGRLIAYTRQMDAMLHDDSAVKRYRENFLEENYRL